MNFNLKSSLRRKRTLGEEEVAERLSCMDPTFDDRSRLLLGSVTPYSGEIEGCLSLRVEHCLDRNASGQRILGREAVLEMAYQFLAAWTMQSWWSAKRGQKALWRTRCTNRAVRWHRDNTVMCCLDGEAYPGERVTVIAERRKNLAVDLHSTQVDVRLRECTLRITNRRVATVHNVRITGELKPGAS